MDERSHRMCGSRTGAAVHVVAWVLLALTLLGIFCWRVASTEPRRNAGPSVTEVRGE